MLENKRLKEGRKHAQIEGENKNRGSDFQGFSSRKKRGYLRIYKAYMITAISTVLAVAILLLFGVNSSGDALMGRLSLISMVDKIGGLLLKTDFRDMSVRDNEVDNGGAPLGGGGTQTEKKPDGGESIATGGKVKGLYEYDYSLVPEGSTPIVPMDLSLIKYGAAYINNSTGYTPDILKLLSKNLKNDGGYELMAESAKPVVLIVHTHGTEAYSDDGALYYTENGEDYARSEDAHKNVVAVGNTVAQILNENGISTIHCTILHDNAQYKDSYARAEETIRRYLEEYPSIKLVIDIHRDSIVRSNGELIRPVAEYNGEAAAQLMCVVGSDWGGQECPRWENNLSLALKLREKLNEECENICRPTSLKASTYNQELSKYSLLIEVGASGNSLTEAQRSARLLAQKLCELMKEI